MKISTIKIRLIAENGREMFTGTVDELPLKEEYILKKSIELFNDKEPCIIHRTHIAKKFYCELYEKLRGLKESGCSQTGIQEADGLFDCVDMDTTRIKINII